MKRLLSVISLALVASSASASIVFSRPFGCGMVLQRDREVVVRGLSGAGERMRVAIGESAAETTAATNGEWLVRLPPMAACCEGRDLVATAQNAKGAVTGRAVLTDVLVGEVWLVCGQSNVQVGIWGGSPRYRDGRGAYVTQVTERPLVRTGGFHGGAWKSMKRRDCGHSALAYYFGLELHDATKIPVGLIVLGIGGIGIDPWLPPEAYETHPAAKDDLKRDDWQKPSVQWRKSICRCAPFTFRGVVWYQGETNAKEGLHYKDKLHALYDSWSQAFGNPDMKFYLAELAPLGKADWFAVRQAQRAFVREQPNAAIAITCDVGNEHDIHPNDKRTVAQRLALHALRRDIGWKDVVDNSPELETCTVVSNRVRMTFSDAKSFYVYNQARGLDAPFEVRDANGAWVAAQILNGDRNRGTVTNAVLEVGSAKVAAPTGVRYLYNAPAAGFLYGGETGLPIGGFLREL